MNFYQVNQKRTFEREFTAGYLCSPNDKWGAVHALRTRGARRGRQGPPDVPAASGAPGA